MKKIFGEVNLNWIKVIIFAVLAGVYTALMAILPVTNNTSFKDITVNFEVWTLFGIFIIMNSKSAKDSALKCFVFFLISQPLVYLIQVPFSTLGWGILGYYKNWIVWTLLTIPMGFIGYYMKKDKWWGLLILTPMLIFLGCHYYIYLGEVIYSFPHHILSSLFCFASILLYPICIFENKKIKISGFLIGLVIILVSTFMLFENKTTYNTTVLVSGGSTGTIFDNTYKVYLDDESFGTIHIDYNNNLQDYMVNAEFKKSGKTNIILEDSNGNKTIFEINIRRDSYDINKK